VAEDDEVGVRIRGRESLRRRRADLVAVHDDDVGAGQLEARDFRKTQSDVDVSADSRHRSNLAEPVEHGRRAHVPTVQDVVDVREGGEDLGPKQAVCVGDDPDAQRPACVRSS
jgi:hypothetical protein